MILTISDSSPKKVELSLARNLPNGRFVSIRYACPSLSQEMQPWRRTAPSAPSQAEQTTSDCITSRHGAAAIGYTEVELCLDPVSLELGGFRVNGSLSCDLAGSDLLLRGEYKLF